MYYMTQRLAVAQIIWMAVLYMMSIRKLLFSGKIAVLGPVSCVVSICSEGRTEHVGGPNRGRGLCNSVIDKYCSQRPVLFQFLFCFEILVL